MARCEECLHFEVCEALEQGNGLMKVNPIHCGCYKNTADVAPKSEVEKLNKELDQLAEEHSDLIVEKDKLFDIAEKQKLEIWRLEGEIERLKRICNSYALQYGTVTDQQKVIDKAKAEVANQIFEEIEREIDAIRGMNFTMQTLDYFIAELKKKYTEANDD